MLTHERGSDAILQGLHAEADRATHPRACKARAQDARLAEARRAFGAALTTLSLALARPV